MTRKSIFWFALLALMLGFASALLLSKQQRSIAALHAGKTQIQSDQDSNRDEYPINAAPVNDVTRVANPDPFSGIKKNRKDTSLDDDFFGPQSREEQLWLDRNGYPTKEQVEVYTNAPDALLEQAARNGDKVAEVFLNQRNLMRGIPDAEEKLLDQAAKGTTYALLGMAGFYAGSKTAADPTKAYAYTRAIEMLGDQKMGLTRDFILHGQMDPASRYAAEAYSLKVYNDILRRRRSLLGPNAAVVDPRPVTLPKEGP